MDINKPQVANRYAIFATGGKQYQAEEGKTIQIEKIEGLPGTPLEFTEVMLRKLGEDQIEIGQPFLGVPVRAEIVKQMKGHKVIVFRFKRRKKSRVKSGHRQNHTIIRVTSI